MYRLFVGLALPDDVRRYLLGLRTGIRSARWQRDDQLHITLRFVGEVDGGQARELDMALSDLNMPTCDLAVSGAGFFGSPDKPRLLWAGVEPREEVTYMHRKIEAAAVRAGIAPDHRRYIPHVTLARMARGREAAAGVGAFLEAHGNLETPPFRVCNFILYSSHLSADGPIYRIEATYPLGDF